MSINFTKWNRIVSLIIVLALLSITPVMADDPIEARKLQGDNELPETLSQVGNQYVQVFLDDSNGMFVIGTTSGQSLIFGYDPDYPSPWSSHTIFNADGTFYTNDVDFYEGAEFTPPISSVVEGNSIVTTYQIPNFDLIQRLTPVENEETGSIWIQYMATNTSSESHNFGVLLELDTMVNDNDAAPLSTSFGLVSVESSFTAPNIPTFWQAFESPVYDPTLLIGQGTLTASGAITPDVVIAGQWGLLYSVVWDYTPSGDPYSDSGVINRWDPVPVPPGQTVTFGTFYGTGEASISGGQLALVLAAPTELVYMDSELTPNPFEVNLIVQNFGTESADDLTATITLPTGLSLDQGTASQPTTPGSIDPEQTATASWLVTAAESSSDETYTYSVMVTSSNAPQNSITRTIFVPGAAAIEDGEDVSIIDRPVLHQNQPNPFAPSTRIAYTLPQQSPVELTIYDGTGRLITTLVNEIQTAGHHEVAWRGTDANRQPVGSGLYLYQLKTESETISKRMLLVR